jgi:hypothetical protein
MMDAQIPGRRVAQFKPFVKEDVVYYIKYFEVAEAHTQYRPVDRLLMAKFTAHTTVTEDTGPPSTFSSYACKILSFDELRGRTYKKDILSGKSPWPGAIYIIAYFSWKHICFSFFFSRRTFSTILITCKYGWLKSHLHYFPPLSCFICLQRICRRGVMGSPCYTIPR